MKSIIVLFLLCVQTVFVYGQQAGQSAISTDFSGTYVAKGFRPGESYTSEPTYVIRCAINKTGDYYQVRWYEKGKLAYYGLGLHVDNVLAVSYLSVDNSIYGTVSYKDMRAEKGYLVGAWCIARTHPDALSNPSNGMEVLWPEQ